MKATHQYVISHAWQCETQRPLRKEEIKWQLSLLLSFDVWCTLHSSDRQNTPQSSAVVMWAVLYSWDGQTDRQLSLSL